MVRSCIDVITNCNNADQSVTGTSSIVVRVIEYPPRSQTLAVVYPFLTNKRIDGKLPPFKRVNNQLILGASAGSKK